MLQPIKTDDFYPENDPVNDPVNDPKNDTEDDSNDDDYDEILTLIKKRAEDEDTLIKSLYNEKKWDEFWKENVCDIAANYGWIDLLVWGKENGGQCTETTFSNAVKGGHLEIMELLHKNGCPMNESAYVYAIILNNSLETLKWLKKSGCPWNEDLCYCASRYPEIVEWLNENNCPCNRTMH